MTGNKSTSSDQSECRLRTHQRCGVNRFIQTWPLIATPIPHSLLFYYEFNISSVCTGIIKGSSFGSLKELYLDAKHTLFFKDAVCKYYALKSAIQTLNDCLMFYVYTWNLLGVRLGT